MGNITWNLWRKEWREQRWKLALGCILLGGFTLVGLRSRMIQDYMVVGLVATMSVVLLPILASMDLLAGEREGGTLVSLLALPVRPWRILAAKLAAGITVCIAPVIVACAIACLIAGGREMTMRQIVVSFAAAAALAGTALIWMLAFSARQPSEARAAVVGIGVLAGWMLLTTIHAHVGEPLGEWVCVRAVAPLSLLEVLNEPDIVWLALVIQVQAIISAALIIWTIRRFTRLGRTES